MSQIKSFRDLIVYQKLKALHLQVNGESLRFPKFETYELGSQVRRSSNSAPALIAEGWGSRHTNIYMEAINRAMGEAHETQHHLSVAADKQYFTAERFQQLDGEYDQCGKMLERLYEALTEWRDSRRATREVRETPAPYVLSSPLSEWQEVESITARVLSSFDP
jgi:four helix bundle protein